MKLVLFGNLFGLYRQIKDDSDHRQKDGEVIVKTNGRYNNEKYNGAIQRRCRKVLWYQLRELWLLPEQNLHMLIWQKNWRLGIFGERQHIYSRQHKEYAQTLVPDSQVPQNVKAP